MALAIGFNDDGEIIWHVGQTMSVTGKEVLDVVSVTADGDELYKVMTEIVDIPKINREIVVWFGDHARFIVANLNY